MPQMKYWNGSSWVVPEMVKTWNGSQWVERSSGVKYWNGSAWIGAGLAPSNYLVKDGKGVNGVTFSIVSAYNGTLGYDSTIKAMVLDATTHDGGWIAIRSNNNFDVLGKYTKICATMNNYYGGDDGGYGQVQITNPNPETYNYSNGSVMERNGDSPWQIKKSVPLFNVRNQHSLLIGCNGYENGTFRLYVRDVWME